MPLPLLGLASLIGREYANTLPDLKDQDSMLKLVSPQTYYGNQLIQYLGNKLNPGVGDDLKRAQGLSDYYAEKPYYDSRPENQLSQDAYNQQMAELNAKTNTPESQTRFEDTVRDLNYGTTNPIDNWYVGPQTEDSERFKLNETMLPRRLESIPVESSFTPAQLDALRERIYGVTPEVGPQQEPSQAPGSGFSGAGGDFMPRGGGKEAFSASMDDIEQYLRGGVVGRRRA